MSAYGTVGFVRPPSYVHCATQVRVAFDCALGALGIAYERTELAR